MAIDILPIWRASLAALPPSSDNSWSLNFAKWVAERVLIVETNPSALVGTLTFVFNQAVFATQLMTLAPVTDQLAGITNFANAWETAILTTIFPATLNVSPGSFMPPATPATTFSVVTSVILDPISLIVAKNKIIELATSAPVSDPAQSEFPEKFRDAFTSLTITVTGMNSVAPTPGPLIVPNIPLI